MTGWVIDCSFAAALFLPNKSSDHVRAFFKSAGDRKELLETDNTYSPSFVQKMYEITRTHGLSAYDAAYLEFSLRLHASIASLDTQLIKAAEGSGVTTYH